MGFWQEFREFISRGNVIDLAVGIVIGAAFTAIVTSMVDDLLMPLLGIVIGGIDFSNLAVTVDNATLTYGSFIQSVVNFLIIAFAIFLLIRTINRFQRKQKVDPPPAPPEEIQLLTEIRDLLKAQADQPGGQARP